MRSLLDVGVGALLAAALANVAQGAPGVRTIAGSGAAGISDGRAQAATFLLPDGVALAKDGSIYISDRAAQRIRLLTPQGDVRTVAGSGAIAPPGLIVSAGYRDGPALQAQFSGPEGLAIGPDGALYIADSYNYCIRKLANSVVSTAAGKCGTQGTTDGPAGVALFFHPKALAFDSSGSLYVADDGAGLRKIGADGAVTTIHFASYRVPSAIGVTVAPEGTVAVTTLDGIVFYIPSGGTDKFVSMKDVHIPASGPNQIAALGDGQFAFTDYLAHNVRYIRLPAGVFSGHYFARAFAGGDAERNIENAGYLNGPLSSARFYDPMGIAISGNQAIIVDAGNRRIRELELPREYPFELGLRQAGGADDHYEVALVGPSWMLSDTTGSDSICTHVETVLDQSRRFSKPVRCRTVALDDAQEQNIDAQIKNVASASHVDLVITAAGWMQYAVPNGIIDGGWPQNAVTDAQSVHMRREGPGAPDAPAAHARMQNILETLKPLGTRLAVVWVYAPRDISLTDSDWLINETPYAAYPLTSQRSHNASLELEKALAGLPLVQYDLWNDLIAYESSPGAGPLFRSPIDQNPNPRGNAFLGDRLAQGLLRAGLAK